MRAGSGYDRCRPRTKEPAIPPVDEEPDPTEHLDSEGQGERAGEPIDPDERDHTGSVASQVAEGVAAADEAADDTDDTDDTDDEAGAARHGERTAAGVDDAETDAETDDLATDGPVARPALDDHEIAPAGDAGVSDELADLDLDLDAPTGAAVAGAEAGIDLYDGLPDLADAGQVLGEPPADLDLGDQPAPGDTGDGWDDVI